MASPFSRIVTRCRGRRCRNTDELHAKFSETSPPVIDATVIQAQREGKLAANVHATQLLDGPITTISKIRG